MSITPASACSRQIIEALGLKQKYIKRITIDLDADSAVFCRVEFYPDLDQVDAITRALETVRTRYSLVEVKNDDLA
jgi:hypothetical protein